jgi:hypothetical protein
MYNFWQYLHVLFATTWVGAAVLDVFLSLRLSALRDDPVAGPATGLMQKSSVPLFIGSSLGTLITGLILAFGWVTFDPLWIKIGLGGAILSIVVGIAYFAPHGEKVEAAVEASGPNDPAVIAMVRQVQIVSVAELFLFAVIVWTMVAKPV